jgi:8-oxo-dGTP pyrophosphatase MutT (NUDIX family)
MVTQGQIRDALDAYVRIFPEEAPQLEDLYILISSVPDPTIRTEFRGHVTCSACLLNARGEVLMVGHRSLQRSLLPGGHVEASDDSLRGAAMRELLEETGVGSGQVSDLVVGTAQCPVEVDRHTIPDNPKRAEPEHEHWDFRFAFLASAEAEPEASSEVTAAEWQDPEALSARLRTHLRVLSQKGQS